MERWRKWSFLMTEASRIITELRNESVYWIGVKKERQLQLFRMAEDERVKRISLDKPMGRCCTWEMANLGVEGTDDKWWSLGFEAFGNGSELWNTMVIVAENILSRGMTAEFGIHDSYGYPRWLQHIGRSQI